MDLYSRIRRRREELNMSQEELARKMGYKNRSTIAKIESGVNEITQSKLRAFAQALRTTEACLMGWENEPVKGPELSVEELKIARDYGRLDSFGKDAVRAVMDAERRRCAAVRERGRGSGRVIPFRCSIQPASAGTGTNLGPDFFETIYVQANGLTRRASFGVPVRGDSMEPLYHNGDILMIEGTQDVEMGEVGVFILDGEGYVKKRGEGELISLNPAYPPVPVTEEGWCIGRVIGVLNRAWITSPE